MTENQIFDKINQLDKIVRDGGELSDLQKQEYKRLEELMKSTSKPTKAQDQGTMTSKDFAAKMNKMLKDKKLKVGDMQSYTNEKGVKKTFKYTGKEPPNAWEKVS